MTSSIVDVLRTAWVDLLNSAQALLPHLVAMVSLVLVGLLIAWILGFVLRHVLRWVKFDRLAERMGASALLGKAGLPSASDLAGSMAFWVVWAAFVLSGLEALGFTGGERLTASFMSFVPRLGVGAVILVVGLVAANFAWRATLLAAVNANLPSARQLSGAVRLLIVAVTVAMTLEQIGVAKTIMQTAFAIAFGAVMLGVAIAIGIGGGPVARRVIERQFPETPREEGPPPDQLSHL